MCVFVCVLLFLIITEILLLSFLFLKEICYLEYAGTKSVVQLPNQTQILVFYPKNPSVFLSFRSSFLLFHLKNNNKKEWKN